MAKSPDELKLDRLRSKREKLFRRVQVCYDAGEALKADTESSQKLENFKIRYSTFSNTVLEYRNLIDEIIILKQQIKPDENPSYSMLEAFEDLTDHIEYMAAKFIKTPVAPLAPNTDRSSGNNQARIHMPKIELVKFDGSDIMLWPLFYENFKQLVHVRTDFSNAEKLQYLLGSISGKALKVCSNVETIPNNYPIIWNTLEKTYQDKKFLSSVYLDRILNCRSVPNHNPSSLQCFLEKFDPNVNALKNLNIPNLADFMLYHIALSKLSQETINSFELIRRDSEIPTYQELIDFVRQQSKIISKSEKLRFSNPNQSSGANYNLKNNKTFFVNNPNNRYTKNCIACNRGVHLLKECSVFKGDSVEERFRKIKANHLCINCFSGKHMVSNCPSQFNCTICKMKHHTLLHRPNNNLVNNVRQSNVSMVPASTSNSLPENPPDSRASVFISQNSSKTVLLSTALVKIVDKWNKKQTIRVIVDNGSMSNFLTVDCCNKLGLTYTKLNTHAITIGELEKPIKGRTSVTIFSNLNPNFEYSFEALIINKISGKLPHSPLDMDSFTHLKYLPLADPTFNIPSNIDGLIGASLFADILGTHKVTGIKNSPTAIQTTLGYLVLGSVDYSNASDFNQSFCTLLTLDSLVEKMFEIENYTPPIPKNEDNICEQLFVETVSRDSNGRFTVSLPFKLNPSDLGDSYLLAEKRLFALEKQLEKYPDRRQAYNSIFKDYLDQRHMSLIPKEQINNSSSYFIPHHCVYKPESTSTPCRVVFDASMKSTSGLSLNDILYTGPKLQSNIFTILLNFRLHPVAINADIKQCYRQINVVDCHRSYQRVLWRFNVNDPISVYELNTVTFGVRSSPYLCLRTIKFLAESELNMYPKAVECVDRDMYMDDVISSAPDVESAYEIHSQLVKLFQSGGFPLLKWVSNSQQLLDKIPNHLKSTKMIEFDKTNLKILGLQWNPYLDIFIFKLNFQLTHCTKRNLLSCVARIFDPLGFLSPLTLFIKLLIKKLWKLNFHWDQVAPVEITKAWTKFQNELYCLNELQIPRHIFIFENVSLSLIGFSDASMNAYAAVVYVRSVDDTGNVNVNLLCSQSKVCPNSKISLPRLELCAATLLAQLLAHIRDTYNHRKRVTEIFAFSDSMITLNWIHSTTRKWKPFVSNRVSKIKNSLAPPHWFFVPTQENVSDCASRGLTPLALIDHSTWLSGPTWLKLPSSDWPIKPLNDNNQNVDQNEILEDECVTLSVLKPDMSPLYTLIEFFSSWTKLLHSTIYVLRFAKILPHRNRLKADYEKSELLLIRAVQQRHFSSYYKNILENKPLPPHLRILNPFIHDGIIRVGGRLANSTLCFNKRYPILLPKSDPFVTLLIDYNHKLYSHTGAHLLHSLLRQNYWILSARNIIRQRTWKCNYCFRITPKPTYPIMSNLPIERVSQAKAFLSTGVDYTGSFQITLSRRRGIKTQKAYVCLFICLATKAVHLELASDLSTDSFLAAFKRFISRRGNCATLFSDNGTNFVGGKRKLDEISELTNSRAYKDAFHRELFTHKIEWKFNPPSSPHFGGIWEANIKSVKTHLTRVINTQILTYEEFSTVLAQIEALLNSRPLCILSSDPNDPSVLTPAHFIYGSPLNSFPSEDHSLEPLNRLNRYKLLDAIVQHYWKRWHLEYLHTLQTRLKWNTNSNPVEVGTLVIVMQDNIPPLKWPLAVIEKLHPGKDGIARVASIKTRNGTYIRPIIKLCPLPTQ